MSTGERKALIPTFGGLCNPMFAFKRDDDHERNRDNRLSDWKSGKGLGFCPGIPRVPATQIRSVDVFESFDSIRVIGPGIEQAYIQDGSSSETAGRASLQATFNRAFMQLMRDGEVMVRVQEATSQSICPRASIVEPAPVHERNVTPEYLEFINRFARLYPPLQDDTPSGRFGIGWGF